VSYGGIEGGGTKWRCALADDDGDVLAAETFLTRGADETIVQATEFFQATEVPRVVGIGCFGPIDLRRSSATYGSITTTPKPGWAGTDVLGVLEASLGTRVTIDTDVNAAALGEAHRGRGRGLETFVYVTVGTGIGVGVFANGALLRGLSHPEAGHLRIPHDRTRDPFPGSCPYHGDCFEGLASGEALRQRYGHPAEELHDSSAWELEAQYLALGLLAVIHTVAPQRVIVGGGVSQYPTLLPRIRELTLELVAGYSGIGELTHVKEVEDFIVPPALGGDAGLVGAIELARMAAEVSN